MKGARYLAAAVFFVTLSVSAHAVIPAGCVQVSASGLGSASRVLEAAGSITFAPVNASGQALSFQTPCSIPGQAASTPVTVPVINGAFSVLLPDTSLTSPINVCFSVAAKDTNTGYPLLGPGYTCVQPAANNSWCSSQACTFDLFPPNAPALTPSQQFVSTINGVYGAMTFQGAVSRSGNILTFGGSGSVGDSDVVGQSASQGSVNLVGTVPSTGKYRITYYASQHALCTTGLNAVTFTFTWNDGLNARAANSVALTLNSSQSSSSGSIQGAIPIFAAASTSITYTSTVTGSCATGGPSSYDAHIAVENVQ